MKTHILLVPALLLTVACQRDGATAAPYADGTTWTLAGTTTRITTPMRQVAGGTAAISKGAVGAAEDCDDAAASSGSLEVTEVFDSSVTSFVVGNSVTHHPIEPGHDGFNGIGVSVIAEQGTEDGTATTKETFFFPDADEDSWEENSIVDFGREIAGRYHGVAADEYIVSLFPLDLWTEDFDGDQEEPGNYEQDANGTRFWTLLSRHNPKKGDVWTSVNGNTMYHYDGPVKADVAGKSLPAHQVTVSAIENYEATGGDVLADCLDVGKIEATSTQDDVDDLLTAEVRTIDGCGRRYEHSAIGTEIWANDALVQFTGRRVFIEITDFGWEWYDDDNDFCTRQTARLQPTDNDDAQLFVEYNMIVEETLSTVTSWEVVPDGGGEAAAE
jgi:hypothetical protein